MRKQLHLKINNSKKSNKNRIHERKNAPINLPIALLPPPPTPPGTFNKHKKDFKKENIHIERVSSLAH